MGCMHYPEKIDILSHVVFFINKAQGCVPILEKPLPSIQKSWTVS